MTNKITKRSMRKPNRKTCICCKEVFEGWENIDRRIFCSLKCRDKHRTEKCFGYLLYKYPNLNTEKLTGMARKLGFKLSTISSRSHRLKILAITAEYIKTKEVLSGKVN